jgi:hypothetical protein
VLTEDNRIMIAYVLSQYVHNGCSTSKPTEVEVFAGNLWCSLEEAGKILRLYASTTRAAEENLTLGDVVPGVELSVDAIRRIRELAGDYERSMCLTTDVELITEVALLCCVIPAEAKRLLEMNVPERTKVPA